MNEAERHERVTQLFLAACELPDGERALFLDEQCADDPGLKADVEAMLAEDARNSSFLETPALGEGFGIEPAEVAVGSEQPPGPIPSRIGSFNILEVLGEGGMGIVYLAEQDNPRRRVALKVIRPGLSSDAVFKRFEQESHILGRLHHPGIAQVHDAGLADIDGSRRPYFAMEYVKGEPLTTYAETQNLGTRDRLLLMQKVCDAVHHAHQKSIIHRDLKPGNILVDESGQPKILDFGVSRVTDADVQATTMRTDIGQLIGTISYMSPEQIEGDPDALDTRSDVYALGVICYRLLAGRLPYDLTDKVIHEVARVIRDEEPTPMSSANRLFRGDVETIVHKALEKDRERRYQSASDFGADIGRYVRDEPIVARPASAAYHLRKFARRNRALAGTVVLAFTALSVATVAALWQAHTARLAQRRAIQAERLAIAQSDFLSDVLIQANPDTQPKHDITLREVLHQAATTLDERLRDQPMAEAALRRTLGHTLVTLLDFSAAEVQLRKQRQLLTTAVAADDPRLLENAHLLVRSLVKQGKLAEAGPMLEQSLRYFRDKKGPESMETLSVTLAHARYLKGLHRETDAENLYHEIINTVHRIRSKDHPLALICEAELGILCLESNRLEQAAKLLTHVLDTRRRTLGLDAKDTLTAMHNLARVYLRKKQYEQSKQLLEEALSGQRRVWGENHTEPLTCEAYLIRTLIHLKQYDEARTLGEHMVSVTRESLGPDHRLSKTATSLLAEIGQTQED